MKHFTSFQSYLSEMYREWIGNASGLTRPSRGNLIRYAAMITLLLTLVCGNVWGDTYLDNHSTPSANSGLLSKITVTSNVSFNNSSLQIGTNGASGSFTVESLDGSYIDSIVFSRNGDNYSVGSLTVHSGTTGTITNRNSGAVWKYVPSSSVTTATLDMSAPSGGKTRLAPVKVYLKNANYEYFTQNFSSSGSSAPYTITGTKSNGSSDVTITANNNSSLISSNAIQLGSGKQLTITSSGHNIKSIHFSCVNHGSMSNISANTGTYSSNGWTKSTATNTVTFTSSGSNANIVGISVELEAGCTSISPSLSYTSTSLMVGDDSSSPTLTGNTGSGTVTWTSSDEDVATVNESTGVVTAVAAGTATITASIAANGGYCNGSATANFTITRDPVGEDHELEWTVRVENSETTVTTTGKNSTSSYLTSMSNISIGGSLTVDNTGKNSGTGKIKPTSGDKVAANCLSMTFTVADGYTFTPSDLTLKTTAVSTKKTVEVEISDTHSHSKSATWAQSKSSSAPDSHDYDLSGSSYEGTVTIKIWVYNDLTDEDASANNGYRLGTPITLVGDVAAAPSSDCSAFEFHYGTHDADDWETACFEQVGETNEWKIEDFTIPSTPNFYVGYHGDGTNGWNSTWSSERAWTDWPTKSDNKWQGQIFLAPNDGALGSFAVGQATGATGTLTIHSDYNDYNKYLSFTPDGYGITYGGSGHAFTETATSNMYETDVVTLPDVSSTTYTMGFQTATAGTYVTGIHSSAAENINAMGVTIKDGGKKKILLVPGSFNAASAKYAVYDVTNTAFDTDFMTDADGDGVYEGYVGSNCTSMILCRMSSSATTSDLSSANWEARWNQTGNISIGDLLQKYEITSLNGNDCAYTTTAMHPATSDKGKFRMWANSADQNWYVHFIPYYVLSYDANGGSGTTAQTERNSESSTLTVSVASNGFTAPTGKHFVNWGTTTSGGTTYTAGASYSLTADATLYAQWAWNTYDVSTSLTNVTVSSGTTGTGAATHGTAYSVTLAGATGYNLPASVTVTIGGSPATLTTDYTWNSSTGVLTVLAAKVTGNISITASGVAQTYSITYKDQGDVAFSGDHASGYPTTHTYGSSTTLKTASKTGYTFGGWYTNSACTGDAVASLGATDYTAGITLYAKWTIKTYTVTMAASPTGYGSVSPTSIASVPHGSEVSISSNVLTLNGTDVTATATASTSAYTYAFSSWSVSDGAEITEAQTITATFTRTANTYDVDFTLSNAAYSSGTDEGENVASYGTNYSVVFAASSGYSLPDAITVTIGGNSTTQGTEYTWNSSTGALTVNGSYITGDIAISITADADVTTYTVTYAAGVTLTSGDVPTDATAYDSGEEVTVKGNTGSMVYTGYTFRGWTSGDYFYKAGDKFTISANTTLTAVWDSGSGGGECNTTLFSTDFGDAAWSGKTNICNSKSADNETYNGITFHSYNTSTATPFVVDNSAGTLTWCNNNMGNNYWIAIPVTGVNGSITITVDNGSTKTNFKWALKRGTVVAGSPGSGTNAMSSSADPATITIDTVGASNYIVYLGRQGSSLTTLTSITITTPCASSNYTVSFDDQTGFTGSSTLPAAIVGIPSGKKIVQPSDPTASGYEFGGWYSDAACTAGNEINWSTMTITADKTIYAKWCATHTVTWIVNGETYTTGSPTTSTTDCDGITTMPTAPADNTLSGCANSFRGWSATNLYGEATNTQPTDLFVTAANAPTINADKTFYAVFGTATSAPQVGTVIWSEDWTGESNNATPSGPTTGGGYAIAGASIGYEYTDGTGDNKATTKVATGTNAGGVSPELMVGFGTTTAGAFTVTGLPKKGAKELTLIFKRNNTTTSALTPSVSGEGYSISKVSGDKAGTYVYTITCGSGSTFSLTFTGSTTKDNNVRVDDIVLKVKTDGATNYRCICPSLTVTPELVTASSPIFITSAASKTVRSQDSLRIVGSGLQKGATLSISSPASKFALKSRLNGTISTDANGAIDTVAYIYYSPDAGDTSDGLDKNNSFTITDGTNSETVSTALIGRHLPANFVIAAKSGDKWYALPSNMSKSAPAVVEIDVDDANDPTQTTTSFVNAYGLYTQHDSIKLAMRGYVNAPLHGDATGSTNIGKSSATNIDNIQKNPGYIWFLTQTNTSITNSEDAKYIISTPNNTNPLKLYETPNPKKWGLYSYSSSVVSEIRLLTWLCTDPDAPTISGETTYAVGETISLTATCASGADEGTAYTWYKGDDWATARAADPVQAAAKGSSGYTFTKASCVAGDAGTYWCEASNGTCTAHNSIGYDIDVPLGDDHMLIWEMTFKDGANLLFNTHNEHSTSSYLTTQTTLTTTGMSALGSDGKSDATPKLENSTSEDNSKCAYVTFTVESGYQFIPDSVILSTTAVSNTKNIVVELGSNKQTWTQAKSDGSTPTKHNYTFSSPKACTGTVTLKIHAYASNTDKFRIGSPIKIYGTVEAISGYTVTYEGNGNTGGSVPVDASSPYDAGATVTVLGNTGSLERNGYEFNDWNTTAEGDGTPYKEDDTFTMPGEDVVLYAQWTPNTYTITYNLNGASWASSAGVAEYTVGTGATLPLAGAMTNTGYTFGGWYDNSGLTGSAVTTISTSDYGNKTFWAKWTENTYTITYNANGGTGSTTSTVGHYVTVANNGFTAPDGKTFIEWNTASDDSGTSYSEGEEVELTADMTLYAIWAKTVGSINWTVTKVDSKLYRGGGGYSITAEINDASWDALATDADKLELTATDGVTLRNITKSINASGKAQITANFDITTDVNANATKITFTLNVPENNGYAPLEDDHDEDLDDCGGGASGYVEFFSMIPTANTCSITNTQAYTASNNYTTCECTSSATITTGGSVTFGLYSSGSGTTNKYWEYSSKNGGWKHSIANTWVVLYSTDPFVAGDSIVITNGNSSSTGYYTIVAAASNNTADYHSASQVVAPSTTSPAKNTNYYYILPGSFVSSNYLVIRSSTSSNCYVGTIKAYHAASKGGESPTLTWTPALKDDTDWDSTNERLNKETGDADFTFTATQDKNSLGAITYSSSNTSVAIVNATTGKVHIVGGGSTTITATMEESGCYEEATASYDITVTDNCNDVPGTIEVVDLGCSGIKLTVTGHTTTASTSYQWYKVGSPDETVGTNQDNYTATAAGSYYVIVTNTGEGHCPMASTNTVTVTAKETATATKIVDEWYVKNGRRTPDIALVQTEHATGFTVTSGGDLTDIGGCTFELKDDGIIYLHGTKANGDAPSDMTAGSMTITITATGCGGNADTLNITITKQAATPYKSVAFVVEGKKGDDWGEVTSGQADGSALYEYLDSVGTAAGARKFALTECNIYKTNDEKALKQYYSQFDAILITDNPNTKTVPKGVSGDDAYKTKGYVNAFGALIDVRPILTMEAFVSALKNWSNKGVAGNPSSPNPRQYEMRLQCKDHEIYSGLPTPADGTHVWTEIIDGEEYRHVIMVDSTMTPYNKHAYNDSTSQYPALQGFSGEAMGDLLGLGVIANGSLHAGIERQEEPAARLMLLGIQNKALPNALTAEGKRVIANALTYLCKTNMEEVDDCSNFFKGGASGDETNWKNADNWAKSTLPNYETRVRILAPCVLSDTTVKVAQVDIASSGTSSKIEGGTCSGSLTIAADAALIVSGTVRSAVAPYFNKSDLMPTEATDLSIEANSSGNGTLIFDNSKGDTKAWVQMYSKAQNSEGDWSWQYVAVPFNDNSSAYRNYYGSWLYRWAENNSGWEVVPDRGEVYPWVGYCLTQASAKLYSMDGTLVATDEQTFTVGNNQDMVIGNSWTAPIQIKQFEYDDFGGLTKNIYLFNTGLDENGTGSTSGERYAAGTYVVIPIHAASYTGDSLISSLQAFTVANTSGDDATLTLNYDKHVRPARSTDKVNAGQMHAPSRREAESNNPVVLKIWASGSHYDDRLVLLERNDFSTGYDAGWDGEKILIGGASPEMYSLMESGKESVTATDDLEGTIIGFRAGEDSEYTFSFSFDENAEPLYLLDMDNTSYTRILNENTYTFQTTDNAEHQRFVLTRNAPEIITGVTNTQGDTPRARKIIYNDKIYILYNGRIFDAQGKVVK